MSDNCQLCNKQMINGVCEECERSLVEVEFTSCNTLAERFVFLVEALKPKSAGVMRVLGYTKNQLHDDRGWEDLIKGRESAAEILTDVLAKWLEYYKYDIKLASENLVEPESWRLSFLPSDVDSETAWLTMFWVSTNREAICIKVILGRPVKEFPVISSIIVPENVTKNKMIRPLWSELYPAMTGNLDKKAE